MCSTPRQELTQGLATGRVGTPPTLTGLLSSEQISSLGLVIPLVTPPPFQTNQAEVETSNNEPRLHTEGEISVNIQNPTIFNNVSENATFVNLPKASISVKNLSRKPKPWHVVKKRGIVPDGLVQARLTHFQQLTNQGRGEGGESKSGLGSTNGRSEKRKAGGLDSPGACKQRRY